MLCAAPVPLANGQRVGCGSCVNCLVNRRRAWTARILLEGLSCEKYAAGEVSWVTMTYADKNLPKVQRGTGAPVPTVLPRDTQLLFKRLRKHERLGPFRFTLVGEYGDETIRPHYHALLFGPRTTAVERALRDTWEPDFGHTRTRPWGVHDTTKYKGDARINRARYCASYVTKKMAQVDSEKLLPEQEPEFWRVSRRPGIGCTSAALELHLTKGGSRYIAEHGDVSPQIRLLGEFWPLDYTVRNWLREQLGIPLTAEGREAVFGPLPERPEPTPEAYERAKAQAGKFVRRAKSQARTV